MSKNHNTAGEIRLRRALLDTTPRGLYCEEGGFYIDPWAKVERAIVTHAHSDHARYGCTHYLTAMSGVQVLRQRMGSTANITGLDWLAPLDIQGVKVSLHPAGHILGSAQIRVEYKGEVWVVSGDYKTEADATCKPFEVVQCHTFVTESTFALPVYHWKPQIEIFREINEWWQQNRENGRTSVLFAYSLGKSQRLLAGVDSGIGPIAVHDSIHQFIQPYRDEGIALPIVLHGDDTGTKIVRGCGLVIAPQSTLNTDWLNRFGPLATASASGWMQVRKTRNGRLAQRGFVLSDHADWQGLLSAINATGAEHVAVTHGYVAPLVRYLNECGIHARPLATPYGGEQTDVEGGLDL